MSEQNMSPRLREGIDAAKRGDKTTARRLLQQVLSTDGNNEMALMWMASVVDALEERRFYLERALRVNPNNTRAREALKRLGVTEPATTPPLRTSPAARTARAAPAPNTNLYLIAAAIVAVVVIAVIVASAVSSLQPTPTPTTSIISAENIQATVTSRALLSQTPTPLRSRPTATVLPGIVVTMDPALIPTLPPTFTPTFTAIPSETPLPSPTPLPLSRFTILYSDVISGEAEASLYRARADGTGEERISAEVEGGFDDVDFHPASSRIAFVRQVAGDEQNPIEAVFVAPLDALDQAQQLTVFENGQVFNPSWSPDGSEIVFTANMDGDEEIWSVSDNGDRMTQLTTNEGIRDAHPDYAPDGERIVFASDRNSPGFTQLFTMALDGSDVTQLTNVPISGDPAWSPDGSRIAYVNSQQGDDDIYVMDANGQRSALLTVDDGGAIDYAPVWSPDGRWVFFASNRDGGAFRWFAADFQGNVVPVTLTGRTPQTLTFVTG